MSSNMVPRRFASIPCRSTKGSSRVCHRCFHVSNARARDLTIPLSGPVPTFQPSSSKQLDSLISRMREYIIIPTLLTRRHRDVLFNKHQQLKNNPLFIEIDGENVQLEPLLPDSTPKRSKSLTELINAARTDEDWMNVTKMMSAYHRIGSLRYQNMEHFIRRACQAENPHIVMRCLKRARSSGFRLSDSRILQEVLRRVVHEPMNRQGSKDEVYDQALKHAFQIVELLTLEQHQPSKPNHEKVIDQAWVLGYVLEAVTSDALRRGEGVDRDGIVKLYAGRLISSFKGYNSTHNQTELGSAETKNAHKELIANATTMAIRWIPAWNASRMAQDILGPEDANYDDLAEVTKNIKEILTIEHERISKLLADSGLAGHQPVEGQSGYGALKAWKDSASVM